jgi:hypothetical protein
MPNWKKIIVSGSDATLNSLYVTSAVTASSYTGSFIGDGSGITGIISSSYAISASHAPDTVEIMYFNTNTTALSDITTYSFTVNTSLTTNINQTPGMTLPIGTIVGWRLTTYNASTIGSSETGTSKIILRYRPK